MTPPVRRWISNAVEHPGAFRAFAEKHRLIGKDGKINLKKARSYIERNLEGAAKTHRLRQYNLAANIRRINA